MIMRLIPLLFVLVLLAGCGSADVDEHVGPPGPATWQLTSAVVNGQAITAASLPGAFTIRFMEDDILSGSSACNSIGATYRLEPAAFIILDGVWSTEVHCGAANAAVENVLFSLGEGGRYQLPSRNTLRLTAPAGEVTFVQSNP